MVDIRRVRTVFTGVPGTPWYSNIYFRADETGQTAAEAADAVQDFWTNWSIFMQGGITATVEGEQPIMESESGNILSYDTVTSVNIVGQLQEERLPTANQGLLKLQTGGVVASRKVLGKIFLPGATETQSSNGTLITTTREAMVTAAQLYLVGGPNEQAAVVWSRPKPNPQGGAPLRVGSIHDVIGASVNADFAILRSRRD